MHILASRPSRVSLELAGLGVSVVVADWALATFVPGTHHAVVAIGAFTGAAVGTAAALMVKRRADDRRARAQLAGFRENIALLTLCRDGHILATNRAVGSLGGCGACELPGQPFARLFDEASARAGRPGHILKAASVGGTFEDEEVLVRRDGSRFLAHVSTTAKGSGFVVTITPVVATPAGAQGDRRTDARTETEESVRVRVLGGSTVQRRGRLVDVSERGLCIELNQVVTVEANVVVEWNGGFLLGTVRNSRRSRNGWEIGVELESNPARDVLTTCLKQAAEGRPLSRK